MKEIIDQINYFKWAALHHRWLALLCGIVICAVGWTYIKGMPDQYRAETRVYLDTQSVLDNLLEGLAIDNQAREHAAQVMQRTLVARPNLEKVIRETDLNLKVQNDASMEAAIRDLQSNIKMSADALVRSRESSSNLYSISYTNPDPQLAKSVVETLLNIFVENILGSSRKDTFQAQTFLDEQIALYEQKQREAEQKLKAFKQKHAGVMPQEDTTYYNRVTQLESSIEETQLSLQEAENRITSLQRQINSLVSSARNSESRTLVKTPLEMRIDEMEQKLSELLLEYTEQHPDVINTRSRLEQLKAQEADQEQRYKENPGSVSSEIVNSPAYQELNVLLGQAESEASALRARLESYRRNRQEMESKLSNLPEVEAELASLNRDYEITKSIYQDLVKRREASHLSSRAEQSGDELQFRVIEAPKLPSRPVSPDRIILTTMVMIAGVLGGIGIALLYEQVRPTFYTRQQVEDKLELPILGSVSMYWSEWEKTKRYFGVGIFSVAALGLFTAYLVLLTQHGLDLGIQDYLQKIQKAFI